MSVFRSLFLLCLALLLPACPQLPQPFRHETENPLLSLDGRAGVRIAADAQMPAGFAQAVRASLLKKDVPVFIGSAPAEALPLQLRVRKSEPKGGTVLLELFWELHDTDGLAIGNYDQRARVAEADWTEGKPALLKILAEEAAPQLAGLMPVEEGTRPEESPVQPAAKPRLFLKEIGGAPGDGNQSLLVAMRLALSANGIEITDRPDAQTFRLAGKVTLSGAGKDTERLHLDWLLFDPKDAEMASLEQGGLVPKGSLDGSWGTLSGEIVAGTAQNLAQLVKDAAGLKKKP